MTDFNKIVRSTKDRNKRCFLKLVIDAYAKFGNAVYREQIFAVINGSPTVMLPSNLTCMPTKTVGESSLASWKEVDAGKAWGITNGFIQGEATREQRHLFPVK